VSAPARQRFVPYGLARFELNDGLEDRPNTSVVDDVVELLLEVRHSLPPTARLQIAAVLHVTGRRLRRMRQNRGKPAPTAQRSPRAPAIERSALPAGWA
jgi:hypothetical protein